MAFPQWTFFMSTLQCRHCHSEISPGHKDNLGKEGRTKLLKYAAQLWVFLILSFICGKDDSLPLNTHHLSISSNVAFLLILRIQIADCLSIPTIKMMHNCCIFWMETLWTLKCHHRPICSSAVIYFPADNIQYTGTHNAKVSTTFIMLISGCTKHVASDQWE